MPHLHRSCALILAAALSLASAFAQPGTGTIHGTMTDDSGAIIPAAVVTLTGKGVSKSAQTQADGTYTFAGLAPGQHTVKAPFPGFAPATKQVTVSAGSNLDVPVQMMLAADKQEITVAGEANAAV